MIPKALWIFRNEPEVYENETRLAEVNQTYQRKKAVLTEATEKWEQLLEQLG